MISVPPSDPPDPVETTTQSFRNRAVSIDMLKDEGDPGPVDGPLEKQSRSATSPKAADTGMLLLSQKMLLGTLTISSQKYLPLTHRSKRLPQLSKQLQSTKPVKETKCSWYRNDG
jgi:hypothetical protein